MNRANLVGLVDTADQHPARKRVQGPGVPDAPGLEQALDMGHHAGRRDSRRLVDDQDAVQMFSTQSISRDLMSAIVASTWKPAAL